MSLNKGTYLLGIMSILFLYGRQVLQAVDSLEMSLLYRHLARWLSLFHKNSLSLFLHNALNTTPFPVTLQET